VVENSADRGETADSTVETASERKHQEAAMKKEERKKNQAEAEAQLKLAEAMNRMADKLERAMDPVRWQKIISDAIGMGILPSYMLPLATRTVPGPADEAQAAGPPQAEGMGVAEIREVSAQVTLSLEDREKLAARVIEAVKPQLEEFGTFVKEAVRDMPEHRLRQMAAELDKGKVPQIKRRSDCVFLAFEGEPGDAGIPPAPKEFYLGL